MPLSLRPSAIAAGLAAATLAAGCTDPAAPAAGGATEAAEDARAGEDPIQEAEADTAAQQALAAVMAAEPRLVTGEHGEALVPGVALVAADHTLSYVTTDGAHTAALVTLDGVNITRVAVRPGSVPGDLVAAVSGYGDTAPGGIWWVRDQGGTITTGQIPEMGTLGDFVPVWSPDGRELSWVLPPFEDLEARLLSAPWSDAAGDFGETTRHEDVAVASNEELFDWRADEDGDTRYARDVAYGGTVLYRRSGDGSVEVLAQPSDTVVAAVENRPSVVSDDAAGTGGRGSERIFLLDGPITGPDSPTLLTLRASEAGPPLDVPFGDIPEYPSFRSFHRLAAGLDAVAAISLVPDREIRTFAVVETSEEDGPMLVQHPWPFADDVVDVAFLDAPTN